MERPISPIGRISPVRPIDRHMGSFGRTVVTSIRTRIIAAALDRHGGFLLRPYWLTRLSNSLAHPYRRGIYDGHKATLWREIWLQSP